MKAITRMMAGVSAGLLGLTLLGAQGSMAKGGPPVGTEEEEAAANNLSVPALFVPAVGLGVTCGDYVPASGETTLFDPADLLTLDTVTYGYYYVQGEDDWQATCTTALVDTVSVTADWGDNLTGAPLKAGTPIRVEMGLLATAPADYAFTGFSVIKLTDDLDRDATYGTLGQAVAPYGEVRAWDADARLTIANNTDSALPPVYDAVATAEINSTGRVVYGYNWQLPEAGEYLITFTAPNVNFVGADVGSFVDVDTVTLLVNVAATPGGGGSGGGSGGPGGGGQGGGGGSQR